MKKPISPKTHAIMDYVMAGTLLAAPKLLGSSSSMCKTYGAVGLGILGQNAFSDTPAAIKRAIPLNIHKHADTAILAGLALCTLTKAIRNDKKALGVHVGLLALLTTQYLLTDFKANPAS